MSILEHRPCTWAIARGDLQVGWRGRRTFVVFFEHGTRTFDRMLDVRRFLSLHGNCNPEWEPFLQQTSESDEEHTERLKQTFHFPKAGVGFVGFPDTLPSPTSQGARYTINACALHVRHMLPTLHVSVCCAPYNCNPVPALV